MNQARDLAGLVEQTREFLAGLAGRFDPERVFLAFTGGKDSTVALGLWRGVMAERGLPARALSLDTGLKFPEVTAHRDALAKAWGVDLEIVRPEVEQAVFPVARDKVLCCRELKIKPLLTAVARLGVDLLVTGIRGDEHASRSGREAVERVAEPEHWRAHPLLAWTEMDVWSFIHDQGLPYCGLYDQGYRSLGCVPCTDKAAGPNERSGRDRDKESRLAELKSLGYF